MTVFTRGVFFFNIKIPDKNQTSDCNFLFEIYETFSVTVYLFIFSFYSLSSFSSPVMQNCPLSVKTSKTSFCSFPETVLPVQSGETRNYVPQIVM